MARRRTDIRSTTSPSPTAKPGSGPSTTGTSAEGPTSSARGNWIDKLDRAARRPLLAGDYVPGSGKTPRKRAPQ